MGEVPLYRPQNSEAWASYSDTELEASRIPDDQDTFREASDYDQDSLSPLPSGREASFASLPFPSSGLHPGSKARLTPGLRIMVSRARHHQESLQGYSLIRNSNPP